MYKDRLDDETKEPETVELEEIFNSDVLKPQDSNVQLTPPIDMQTPHPLRRLTREKKPIDRYSHSLQYLLLTDNGEPECYEEAL